MSETKGKLKLYQTLEVKISSFLCDGFLVGYIFHFVYLKKK